MLSRTKTTLWVTLFLALPFFLYFYVDQVWLASKHPPASAIHPSYKATEQYYPAEHIAAGFWTWVTADAVSFFTAMLGLFTGALAIVSFIQIGYLRKADITARDTASAALKAAVAASNQVDQMGKASEIAKEAAKATSDSVALAKDTAKYQLRAYVGVRTAKIGTPVKPRRGASPIA
jgi:hypothetical protein